MLKLSLGAKLLLGSGIVGTAAAVVVASSIFMGAQMAVSPPASTDAASGIDYNCNLPGLGFPWLKQDSGGTTLGNSLGYRQWLRGTFMSTVPGYHNYGVALPVRIREDGTPSSVADVYRMLCAVHPDLGGSGLRPMTTEEKRQFDFEQPVTSYQEQFPNLYTDGVARAADEAHIGYERIRAYLLPPIPQGLRDVLASSVAPRPTASPNASPSPSSSPSGAPETRRYRVVVNGYENQIPNPELATANGVHFTYRLIGEFSIERSDPSEPWTVARRRIVTVELTYESLYPSDSYQVTLTCHRRSCERLRQATRLYVQVHGDEATVSWGYFYPEVHITGTCTGCPAPLNRYAQSDDFFARINSASLALEQNWVGPLTVSKYPNGAVQVSFAYGLEQLP